MQVGLIALNLIGEPISSAPVELPPGGYLQLHPPIQKQQPYYNQVRAPSRALDQSACLCSMGPGARSIPAARRTLLGLLRTLLGRLRKVG